MIIDQTITITGTDIIDVAGLTTWFIAPLCHYISRRDWAEVIGAGVGLIFFSLAMHYGFF